MTTAQVEPDAARYAYYPGLRGRTVFITGGATGIGAELAAQTWVVDGGWT
jgi:FlaA1/EpsC-like NDP-sugar epimerase